MRLPPNQAAEAGQFDSPEAGFTWEASVNVALA